MARIAISYRREDTGWITGRIFDRLKLIMRTRQTPLPKRSPSCSWIMIRRQSALTFEIISNGLLTTAMFLSRSLVLTGWGMMGPEKRGSAAAMIGSVSKLRQPSKKHSGNSCPDRPHADAEQNSLPEDVRDLVYRQAAVIDTQIDFNPHMERLIRQIDQLVGEPSRSRPATPWIWKVAVISGLFITSFVLAALVAAPLLQGCTLHSLLQ